MDIVPIYPSVDYERMTRKELLKGRRNSLENGMAIFRAQTVLTLESTTPRLRRGSTSTTSSKQTITDDAAYHIYILCMLVAAAAAAQVDVSGIVIDKESSEPLTGASVIVKGADGKSKNSPRRRRRAISHFPCPLSEGAALKCR